MNGLNLNQGNQLLSQQKRPDQQSAQTIPKQAVDVVYLANSVDILSNTCRRKLELDAIRASTSMMSTSTHSKIQMNMVFVQGKQDTGVELNAMPLNIYHQLKSKCNLELRPCNDINIMGYNNQPIQCIGKTVVSCQHGDVIKMITFYVTSVADTKVILWLNFFKMFCLVSVNCDDNCPCKKINLDIINNQFPRGLEVPVSTNIKQMKRGLVNVNTKLQTNDMKAPIMELSPDLFHGVGTIKGDIVKLDVETDIIPIVQPPQKVPQAMVEPLKSELDHMEQLGVI